LPSQAAEAKAGISVGGIVVGVSDEPGKVTGGGRAADRVEKT